MLPNGNLLLTIITLCRRHHHHHHHNRHCSSSSSRGGSGGGELIKVCTADINQRRTIALATRLWLLAIQWPPRCWKSARETWRFRGVLSFTNPLYFPFAKIFANARSALRRIWNFKKESRGFQNLSVVCCAVLSTERDFYIWIYRFLSWLLSHKFLLYFFSPRGAVGSLCLSVWPMGVIIFRSK